MSTEAPVKLTHNEVIKAAIPMLAGTIAATLNDANADHFSEDDNQFLKFHGSYQQDDRDRRKTGKKYIMMVRSRVPGGVMTAKQWRVFDDLSARYGNNTLRVTTRQTIQFHGILKSNLRPLIKAINESLLSTLAACGDVNRNVLAPPTPAYTRAREQVFQDCHRVALALAPQCVRRNNQWLPYTDLLPPREKEQVKELVVRVRTIGDIISTGLVESPADSVDDIIAEIAAARVTERGSRADDKAGEAAMEDRKKVGYF
jgi:sulfite reductase (NADPH) hemoprotein beta-component